MCLCMYERVGECGCVHVCKYVCVQILCMRQCVYVFVKEMSMCICAHVCLYY